MKTVDLNKVLDLLINEEADAATGLLHEWFVETSKKVHEELMQEDDSLSKDIEDDQEAIKSEEFYSEAEGDDEVADDAEEVAADDVDAPEGDDAFGGDDMGDDAAVDADVEAPAAETIGDTMEDLIAVMTRLKAEFAEIAGHDEEVADEFGGDDVVEPVDFGGEEEEVPADESMTFESEEADADEDKEEVTEAEDDFADLEESWTLEPVKDPNLTGGKEIGADGKKVSLNDKSPLPEHKPADRVGGKAVEIKAEEHHGYDREEAPEVKGKPLLKNQVKKATDGRSKVSKEGDKAAMLNKKDGFGSDSPKSPIGAGATDLRGSDFKRK